ncbi:hypothetical protein J1N35_030192 [Gossypium stocksii]|uniref:Uncharacterized protein n=1 Tax=Gossypium stocksii TaxID=47602 RepID=A0A9D3UZ30_9ROSI|nr:hypothetical protein J1N35_030192 [Gossypium stocksii]
MSSTAALAESLGIRQHLGLEEAPTMARRPNNRWRWRERRSLAILVNEVDEASDLGRPNHWRGGGGGGGGGSSDNATATTRRGLWFFFFSKNLML